VTGTPSQQQPQIGSHRPAPAPAPEPAPAATSRPEDVLGSELAAAWFRQQLDANMQRVVRQLEDRMIVELERRGGRTWRST
jgi:hypothetical protein